MAITRMKKGTVGMEAARQDARAPQFASDRLRLLGPLVSERAIDLARGRLVNPKTRLVEEDGKLPTGDAAAVVKVALLVLRVMNADEWLTNEEEGLLRGLAAKTVGKRKACGEI